MDKRGYKSIKGVKIRFFNACMIVTACILYLFLIHATVVVSARYEELIVHTQNYIACEKNAAMVNDASDYLTEQVRLYAQNMDIEYARRYFEEANVTQRREKVLAQLENYQSDQTLSGALQSAVQSSNDLMVREIYSMKLISVANGYDMHSLPIEIRDTPLEKADAALDATEMIEKARALVFDTEYQKAKAEIYSYVSDFTNGVLIETQTQQTGSAEELFKAIYTQRILLSILLIINILTFVVITLLVVKPLRAFLNCVKNQTPFTVIGAYEFKYLAQVYNDIYKQNATSAANEASLKYRAEHDSLTGIMNREVFSQKRALLKKKKVPLALLLIDVDEFKQVNDRYGHEAGDRVLRKVASLLEASFRAKDYLFRIGGDEFASIIMNITKEQAYVIEEKVLKLNTALQNPEAGLPAVSVSVGVAFSREGYREELYGQADQALYQVKAQGRCGCGFYEPNVESKNDVASAQDFGHGISQNTPVLRNHADRD